MPEIRVLLVEDEVPLLQLLQKYLARNGYQVDACASGADALRCFESDPASFFAIIADLTLPDLPGDQLVAQMLARNENLRVLICSGFPYEIEKIPVVVAARALYLQKPFIPAMLGESLRQLLESS